MIIGIIIIIIILVICWFSFSKKNQPQSVVSIIDKNPKAALTPDISTSETEIFTDEGGREYRIEIDTIQIPRKTYIKGKVFGKYRGDLIDEGEELYNSHTYEFAIYEAQVTCSEFSPDKPFENPGQPFPKEKLPAVLPVALLQNEKLYGLNILEPKLYAFNSVKKLHQIEGTQIFGTFNADITGYILDYTEIEEEKRIYLDSIIETVVPETIIPEKLICSEVETGEIEWKGKNYFRKQYYATNYRDTVWGKWEYTKQPSGGCFSSVLGGLGAIIGLIFLLIMLPGLLYFIPILMLFIILNYLGPFLKWIFRIIGAFLLVAFFFSLFNTGIRNSHRFNPTPPKIVDSPRETKQDIEPIVDDNNNNSSSEPDDNQIQDSIITRFRAWQDYDGNRYEGNYSLLLSAFRNSKSFKTNLQIPQNSINSYDEIIFNLKKNDQNKLDGVYKLFDSIGNTNKLSKIKFAEMVVSFVQDIPYAIILDDECNASLYTDAFTRQHLLNPNALCDGNERFGINTPVEFLASLKGDCDSRTLLLYTIFSHYDYDVALLSSEQYGHSLLGINLPISGITYEYQTQHYVLWETTTPNIRPGILPNEISNLNNWRISLKSK